MSERHYTDGWWALTARPGPVKQVRRGYGTRNRRKADPPLFFFPFQAHTQSHNYCTALPVAVLFAAPRDEMYAQAALERMMERGEESRRKRKTPTKKKARRSTAAITKRHGRTQETEEEEGQGEEKGREGKTEQGIARRRQAEQKQLMQALGG